MIRWLHISDLHIQERADWTNYSGELVQKCKETGKIDFVIVTGDFHDFADKDDFNSAIDFLRRLIRELGLHISRDLFLIPGNHDGVTVIDKQKSLVIAARAEPLEIEVDDLLGRFEAYELFVKTLIPDYPAAHPATVHARTWNGQLTLIHCNTAIGADRKTKTGQVLDIDGVSALDIRKEYPAVILAHNSFFDLHEAQQNRMKDFIRVNNIRAYLCGDRHIGRVDQISYEDNQNRQIPCVVSYKSAPDALDEYSSFGIIIGEWEGTEALLKGWKWESGNGFQPDGSICGKKIEMGSVPADRTVCEEKAGQYQLAKKYDNWIQIDGRLEKQKAKDIIQSMRNFLIGYPCTWSLAFSGMTVKRKQLRELLEAVKAGGIHALLGAGAEGKTTLLKQACVQLYYEGYTVLYHIPRKDYRLPDDLPDNTILVVDDPDDYRLVDLMELVQSLELSLVIAARHNEWNLFCARRRLSSDIRRAVTRLDMKNITDRKEAEAFAACVIKYYKEDADYEKLVDIFLRNARDYGFLYAAMLLSIYDKSQFEEIAKDIIDKIEENDERAEKLLAYAVMFEYIGTVLDGKEYEEYLISLHLTKAKAKEALELELRHSANRWETRHPQISHLFYDIFFGENARFDTAEADDMRYDVINSLLKRYNQYYKQRKYIFQDILSSIRLINMSSSNAMMLERVIEEFKEDGPRLRQICDMLDDSLHDKFGKACYAHEIYDTQIMQKWAMAANNSNGAGGYDKKDSALWIYREACIQRGLTGAIWQDWAKLEAETNDAGSYTEENSALWIYKEACIERRLLSYSIWLGWAGLERAVNGAGGYDKKYSALWIYRRACMEEKVSGYGVWLEWARLEAETNGAGGYDKKNSALWIYRKACIEEKESSFWLWLEWAELETETNGAGDYDKDNSALWIYRKACIEEKETNFTLWSGWARLETETNGAGDYDKGNSALWIYRKGCVEKKERVHATWLDWAELELKTNGAGSYAQENSALWIYQKTCIENNMLDQGLWMSWASLELKMNGAGSYDKKHSPLWIYQKACMERNVPDQGPWMSWAGLELKMNGAGGYDKKYSALWIYQKACIERNIQDQGLWQAWAGLEAETNGAGGYDKTYSALWIYQEACIEKNILGSETWSSWASLEAETNGAGDYDKKYSALWIYQEAYSKGCVLNPSFWLGWAQNVENNRIPDKEWTVENIYQQALQETGWEVNVAMAYADYLMSRKQFEKSREICRRLFTLEKHRVLPKLLMIEMVAGNVDTDDEFCVSRLAGIIEQKNMYNSGRVYSLYLYYRFQKEEAQADKYYEMLDFSKDEVVKPVQAAEEFLMKCQEAYRA